MQATHTHDDDINDVREGISKYREKGNEALLKELIQLHERDSLLLATEKGRHVFRAKENNPLVPFVLKRETRQQCQS